jgi:hypothetical protein
MEPRRSLVCSQQPIACPYPEVDQLNPCPHTLFCWRLILILSFRLSRSSKWLLTPRFPHQNHVCISPFPHMYHMPYISDFSLFDHPNNAWPGWQFMKLLTMKFPPVSCYLLPHSLNQHTSTKVGKQTVYFLSDINFFIHQSLSLFLCNCKYVKIVVISCA